MTLLNGKRIVVTGASRGLGEAMAVAFAGEGASLVLAARTTGDLEHVAERCRDAGSPRVVVVPTDIGERDEVENLVAQSQTELGGIDCFAANAGTSYPGLTQKRFTTLDSYEVDIVDEVLRVNTRGMWLAMKFALPALQRGGSFIAIGSEVGRIAGAGSGIYAVSKAGVDVLVTIASQEMVENGVRVNCLTPGGMVDTHLFGPDKMPDFLKQLPMGYSEPEVIVPAAIWLASDDSTDVTGAQLTGKDFNAQGVEAVHAELRHDASDAAPND